MAKITSKNTKSTRKTSTMVTKTSKKKANTGKKVKLAKKFGLKQALIVLVALVFVGSALYFVNLKRSSQADSQYIWSTLDTSTTTIKVCTFNRTGPDNKAMIRLKVLPKSGRTQAEHVEPRVIGATVNGRISSTPVFYNRIYSGNYNKILTLDDLSGNNSARFAFKVKNPGNSSTSIENQGIDKPNIQRCDTPVETARTLSTQILANSRIIYDPGVHRTPFVQLSRGQLAMVDGSNTTRRSTDVDPKILRAILELANNGIPIRVSRLTTGNHATNSRHYYGGAVDIGNEEEARSIIPYIYNNRSRLGIRTLYFENSNFLRYNLENGSSCNGRCSGITPGSHLDHIHIGV